MARKKGGMNTASFLYLSLCTSAVLLSFLFCSWCTWNVWQCRVKVFQSKTSKSSSSSPTNQTTNRRRRSTIQPIFPWITAHFFTASQFAMLLKFSSNLMMSLTYIVVLIMFIIAFVRSSRGDRWMEYAGDNRSDFVRVWSVSVGILTLAFVLKMTAFFEQLRVTFADTKYRLPQWSPRVLYLIYVAAFIALCIVMLAWSKLVFTIALITALVIYVGGTAALLHGFYERTMDVSRSLNSLKKRDSVTNIEDDPLVEAAVRVSVCCSIAMIGTTVDLVCTILVMYYCTWCLHITLMRIVFVAFDLNANCFALMSCFSQCSQNYYRVFGSLHSMIIEQCVLARNQRKESMQMNVDQIVGSMKQSKNNNNDNNNDDKNKDDRITDHQLKVEVRTNVHVISDMNSVDPQSPTVSEFSTRELP